MARTPVLCRPNTHHGQCRFISLCKSHRKYTTSQMTWPSMKEPMSPLLVWPLGSQSLSFPGGISPHQQNHLKMDNIWTFMELQGTRLGSMNAVQKTMCRSQTWRKWEWSWTLRLQFRKLNLALWPLDAVDWYDARVQVCRRRPSSGTKERRGSSMANKELSFRILAQDPSSQWPMWRRSTSATILVWLPTSWVQPTRACPSTLQVQPSMELLGVPATSSPAGALRWHYLLSSVYSTWRMLSFNESKDPWKAFKESLGVLMAGSNLVQLAWSSVGYNRPSVRGWRLLSVESLVV